MKIKVISDSTCDLSAELIQQHDIAIVPLYVMKNDEEFIVGVTITPADIFAHVAAGGSICSTAARSVGTYMEEFQKYANDYDGIVHISIGANFSSSYQNAFLAAQEFDNVSVIDSQTLTTGQGLIVLKACQLAQTVSSMEEMTQELMEFASRVETSFLVDKLDYLAKGGRCSSVAAMGANLLNLKPCIEVKDGKMGVTKKYRGNFPKCLASYIKERLEGREDLDNRILFMTQTVLSQEATTAMMDAVEASGPFENVIVTTAGCTVSCHCGPGTLGVICLKKK